MAFLDKYAIISPNYEDEEYDDKYTGPDPYQLLHCANAFEMGTKSYQCHSDWGSGCYSPYTSKEGKAEHDYLVSKCYDIINKKDA